MASEEPLQLPRWLIAELPVGNRLLADCGTAKKPPPLDGGVGTGGAMNAAPQVDCDGSDAAATVTEVVEGASGTDTSARAATVEGQGMAAVRCCFCRVASSSSSSF